MYGSIRERFAPFSPFTVFRRFGAFLFIGGFDMTTKEIAEAVGKDITTVQRWVKRMGGKMQSIDDKMLSSTSTYPADFDLSETCEIIEHGMGKNAADLYRMSAKQSPSENSRLDRLEALTEKLLLAVGNMVMGKTSCPAQAQIEAPKLETRDELRRIINKAGKASGDYAGAWNLLYQEIYYRMHRNVKECAKNHGMDTLDYIESEGLLPEAIAIMREIAG
jgi:hypothetical protein